MRRHHRVRCRAIGRLPGASIERTANCRYAPGRATLLTHDGVGDPRSAGTEEEDAWLRLETGVDIPLQRRPRDREGSGAVIADVEDRAAALVGMVVLDGGSTDLHRVAVAVGVDRTATAAALGPGAGGVGAVTLCAPAGEPAVEDDPGDADAAERRAVAAGIAAERASGYVNGAAAILRQRAHRAAAKVRPGGLAPVADEARVDDPQLPTA